MFYYDYEKYMKQLKKKNDKVLCYTIYEILYLRGVAKPRS